jgi:hypothetical protein
MTAALQYITNIDTAYPLAGQNNNSQGFRDNFNNIQTALSTLDTYIDTLAAVTLNVDAPFVTATTGLTALGPINVSNRLIVTTSTNIPGDQTLTVLSSNGLAGNIATYPNIVSGNIQSVSSDHNSFTVINVSGTILQGAEFLDSTGTTYTALTVSESNRVYTITANTAIIWPWSDYTLVRFSNPTFGANVNNTVNTAINTSFNDLLPVRSVIMWYGDSTALPTGWAICNGQTVNGIITPDLRGSFAIGATGNSGDLTNYPVGGYGGTATIALLDHQHSYTDLGHDHLVGGAGNGLSDGANSGAWYNGQSLTLNTTTGIVIDGVINVAGGSQPVLSDNELVHNGNIPPYVALYYIMKVYPLAYAGVN